MTTAATPEYIEVLLHNKCNLKYKIPLLIPIVFHKLSGHDTHLSIQQLDEKFKVQDTGVIAENKEKYISFNVKIDVQLAGVSDEDGKFVPKKTELRFIHSLRQTLKSLDSLAKNLSDEECKDPP